jgi:hypothetical protein
MPCTGWVLVFVDTQHSLIGPFLLFSSLAAQTMHCIKPPRDWGAFTVRPWVYQGKPVTALANSYLIEYCNNKASLSSERSKCLN